MMVIVAALTAFGYYLAQRKVTADAERNLQQIFRLNCFAAQDRGLRRCAGGQVQYFGQPAHPRGT